MATQCEEDQKVHRGLEDVTWVHMGTRAPLWSGGEGSRDVPEWCQWEALLQVCSRWNRGRSELPNCSDDHRGGSGPPPKPFPDHVSVVLLPEFHLRGHTDSVLKTCLWTWHCNSPYSFRVHEIHPRSQYHLTF